MNTLSALSAEYLIKTLPKECIDELFKSYLEDKEYDLKTFVETTTPPLGGWFLVFVYHGIFQSNVGMTCDTSTYSSYYWDASLVAYWFPETSLNQKIYAKETLLTRNDKVYRTFHVPDKIYPKLWDYYQTLKNTTTIKARDRYEIDGGILGQYIDIPTSKNVTYYVPPDYKC